jgi:hypothetical protein
VKSRECFQGKEWKKIAPTSIDGWSLNDRRENSRLNVHF